MAQNKNDGKWINISDPNLIQYIKSETKNQVVRISLKISFIALSYLLYGYLLHLKPKNP